MDANVSDGSEPQFIAFSSLGLLKKGSVGARSL